MNDTPINDLDGAGESDASLEQLVVALAHRRGIRDVNELTSLVFCARHPTMGGRKIQSHETALAQEWIDVRDSVVRPALDHLPSGSVPP